MAIVHNNGYKRQYTSEQEVNWSKEYTDRALNALKQERDVRDEGQDAEIVANTKAIEAEQVERQQEVENLQSSLNAETAARINADESLGTAIASEGEIRQQGVANLQNSLNAETAARINADESLGTAIAVEGEIRRQAVENLQDDLEAESAKRFDTDKGLADMISQEILDRSLAHNDLISSLQSEAVKRFNADNELNDLIKVKSDKGHTHVYADITDPPPLVANWDDIQDKPEEFEPTEHQHTGADIADGSITQAKLSPDIKLMGEDRVIFLAENMFIGEDEPADWKNGDWWFKVVSETPSLVELGNIGEYGEGTPYAMIDI